MRKNWKMTRAVRLAVFVALGLAICLPTATAAGVDEGLVVHYPFYGHMKDVSGANSHGTSPPGARPTTTKRFAILPLPC